MSDGCQDFTKYSAIPHRHQRGGPRPAALELGFGLYCTFRSGTPGTPFMTRLGRTRSAGTPKIRVGCWNAKPAIDQSRTPLQCEAIYERYRNRIGRTLEVRYVCSLVWRRFEDF